MFKSGSRFSQYSNVGAEVPKCRSAELPNSYLIAADAPR
jgi:hypothetical protein